MKQISYTTQVLQEKKNSKLIKGSLPRTGTKSFGGRQGNKLAIYVDDGITKEDEDPSHYTSRVDKLEETSNRCSHLRETFVKKKDVSQNSDDIKDLYEDNNDIINRKIRNWQLLAVITKGYMIMRKS